MGNDTRCVIEDCSGIRKARGWCEMHYIRWRKHGDPHVNKLPMRVHGTPEERFWAKVDADGDCWEWIGFKNQAGYGRFYAPSGKMVLAHRYAYETLVGSIPSDAEIDHLCKNRACVSPAHLDPVSHKENVRRGAASTVMKLRAQRITHCKSGHDLTVEGAFVRNGSGRRRCKECNRSRAPRRLSGVYWRERRKDE